MSIFVYLIVVYGLLSLLCTTVLVAACIIAGRTRKFRTRARFSRQGAVSPRPDGALKSVPGKNSAEPSSAPQVSFPQHLMDVI